MEEVELRRLAAIEAIGIREARGIVLGGVAGDGARRFDGALHGFRREVGGARVAAALAEIHGDAEALVAVVFDGLDLAAAHCHRLADRGRHLHLGVARAALLRDLQRAASDVGHGLAREGKRCGGNGMVGHGGFNSNAMEPQMNGKDPGRPERL